MLNQAHPALRAATLLLSLACCMPAQAEKVFKWTDDQGGVHLTAQPPVGRSFETIAVSTGHSAPPPTPEEATAEVEKTSGNPAAAPGTLTRKDPKVCTSARNNIAILGQGGQIRLTEADGTERILSEEEVALQRKRAEEAVKQHCD